MNSGQIRIDKVSLRMRGVTPTEARRRAGSIAHEIAEAVAREGAGAAPGKSEIGQLSVRQPAAGKGPGVGEQIRRQWSRE